MRSRRELTMSAAPRSMRINANKAMSLELLPVEGIALFAPDDAVVVADDAVVFALLADDELPPATIVVVVVDGATTDPRPMTTCKELE